MKRDDNEIINRIGDYCSNADVLDIGCGDGSRLSSIAARFKSWTGVDPDSDAIKSANERLQTNSANFYVGSAEKLEWPADSFDTVVFTLSLHHVPREKISAAIAEAIRVVRTDGFILFLEPMPEGTFFEAEKKYGCCDGDERKELAFAYYSMLAEDRLEEIDEFITTVVFSYDSFDDFKNNVYTDPSTEESLEEYLRSIDFTLDERQRLNVFKVKR